MDILAFLYLLGIINIVFGFTWKWLFALPSAILFTAIKLERALLLVKAFGAYLLISLTALATLHVTQNIASGWKLLFLPIIGTFVLYMGFASNTYEQYKKALKNYDYELINRIKKDAWLDVALMFGSPILYISSLFVPAIPKNTMNELLFDVILWAWNLPVIGWLIGIGGLLFMIGVIWNGLAISLMLGTVKRFV